MPAFRAPQDLPCLAFAFRIDEDVRRLLPCGDRFYFRARLLFPHRTVDEQRARGAMWTRARMVWFVFFFCLKVVMLQLCCNFILRRFVFVFSVKNLEVTTIFVFVLES